MSTILILQQLYNLADDALEYQLLDRRSFLQFLGLTKSSAIPDAKTVWLSRDRLAQAELGTKLFDQVQEQLLAHGYPSAEREATLPAAGWRVQIQRKGSANKPISDTQKQRNRRIATRRDRVEDVFGAMRHMGRKLVRYMGIVRTTFALLLKTAS